MIETLQKGAGWRLVKQADGTYRLENMDIGEVSMVDRAANQKKWLLAKAEGNMATATLKDDGSGNLLLEDEGAESETTTKTDGTPGAGGAASQAAGSGDGGAVKKMELTAAKKGELAPLADKLLEHALNMRNMVATAKEGKSEDMPTEIAAGLKALSAAFGEMEKACGAPEHKKPAKEGTPEAAAEAAAGKTKTEKEKETPPVVPPNATEEPDKDKKDKVGKADAPTHQKLLDELTAKIVETAENVAKNAKTMDYKDLRAAVSKMEQMSWKMRSLSNVVSKAVESITDEDLAELAKGVVPDRLQKIGRKMSSKNRIQFQGALAKIKEQMDVLFQLYDKVLPAEANEVKAEAKKAHSLFKRVHESLGLPPDVKDNAGAGIWPNSPATSLADAGGPETKATMADVAKAEAAAEKDRIEKREAGAVEPPATKDPEPVPIVKDDGGPGFPMDMNSQIYLDEVKRTGRY